MQAELDFGLLKQQLQQCPEYLISGVHPSVTSEVAQTMVLASWTSSSDHELHATVMSDAEHHQTVLRHVDSQLLPRVSPPAQQRCQRPDLSFGDDAAVQLSTAHGDTLQPPPAGALTLSSEGAPEKLEDAMEDDLDKLLSKPAARQQNAKGTSSGFTPAHESLSVAQQQSPHPSRQPERKVDHAKSPAPRATEGRAAQKAHLEDWLNL